MAAKLRLLLEGLGQRPTSYFSMDSSNSLSMIAYELFRRADEMEECASRIHSNDEARLNREVARTSIREARSVKRLANLASIFLPLSLAATILSMQHRLA